MSKITETLSKIQAELVATKNNFNKFGGYKYRSCESILENLKPLLSRYECSIILRDDIVEVGGRVYVKATAEIMDKEGDTISATAYAREAVSRKGMDDSQLTGATSSYARKYALGGLLAIDDNADADKLNSSADYTQPQARPDNNQQARVLDAAMFSRAVEAVKKGEYTKEKLLDAGLYALTPEQRNVAEGL